MSSLKKANPDQLWVMFQRLPYILGELNTKNTEGPKGIERLITLIENTRGNVTNNYPRTTERIQNTELRSLKISNSGISIKYNQGNSNKEVIIKERIFLTRKQALIVIRAVMRTFSKNHGISIETDKINFAYGLRTNSNQLNLEMRNGSLKILLKFTSDQERKLFRNQFKEEIEKGQLKAEDSGKGQLSLTLFSQEKKSWKNKEKQ